MKRLKDILFFRNSDIFQTGRGCRLSINRKICRFRASSLFTPENFLDKGPFSFSPRHFQHFLPSSAGAYRDIKQVYCRIPVQYRFLLPFQYSALLLLRYNPLPDHSTCPPGRLHRSFLLYPCFDWLPFPLHGNR